MNSSVIYIVCPGHSGSTLLDMLLGMHKDVFSTGELVHLPNQYYRNKFFEPAPSNGMSCSCEKSFYDCGFWGEMIKQLNSSLNYDVFKNPLKFKTAFLMSHEIPHQKKIHKIKRKFLQFTIKYNLHGIDKLMNCTSTKQIKNNELLFSSIHHLSNTSYIVDSTKDMYRLHYLLYSKKINIQVIVLKRNILGVSASGKKQNQSPLNTAKHWMKYYKQLDEVLKYHNITPLTIHYENLVKNPLNEINKVYKRVELSELSNFSGTFIPKDYHIVGGNGLRYKDKVTIKEDNSWQHRLTDSEKSSIKEISENDKIV